MTIVLGSQAFAGLKVKFDCYLPEGNAKCSDLKGSYFHSISFLKQTGKASEAGVVIKVRTLGIDHDSIRYIFIFEGKDDAPDMTLIDDIPLTKADSAIMLQLLTDLQKLTFPYLNAPQPGQTDEYGNFVLAVNDPSDSSQGNSSDDKTTNWYLNNSIFGNLHAGENKTISANVSSEWNYSDPSWRFRASVGGNYQKVIVSLGDKKETQEVVSFNGKTLLVRSLAEKWSIGALVGAAYTPASNYDVEGRTTVGLEWDLVPFLTTNDRNAGFRYEVSLNYHNYVSPNLLGESERKFLSHALGAYFTWHFEKVDVSSGAYVESIVDDLRFAKMGAEASVSWQVTDRLSISSYVEGEYRRALINMPADEDEENPLEQYLNGGNYSNLAYYINLSLSYTFGNSALQLQDQRWKHW